MAEAPVGPALGQALDVHGDLPPKVALDQDLLLRRHPIDDLPEPADLLVTEVLDPGLRVGVRHLDDLGGGRPANPVDIGERDHHPLVARDVDSGDPRHALLLLTLPLLVLGVRAENADNAFSLDHLALGADLLDRRPNLHLVTSLDPLKTFEFRGLPSFNFPDPPSRPVVLR